jgi:hypothetical protein
MNMTKNIGSADLTIRVVIGIAMIFWGLLSQNWLGAIGLVPLLTAVLRWCPAYTLLGINTDKQGN